VAGTLTDGAISVNQSDGDGTSKLDDYNFKTCTFNQTVSGNNWVNVKLAAEARVKTVLLVNNEDDDASYARINPSDIRVGNDPDASKNPSCGVTVTSGGVYKCDLVGRYVGLVQQNSDSQSICELRAYPWESIETTGTTTQSSVYISDGIPYDSSWVTNPRDLWVQDHSKLHQTYTDKENRERQWWGVSFDTSRFINMVSCIGTLDYPNYSDDMELWVGDSPVPTENTKIGRKKDLSFETLVNSYGKHVFIRRNDDDELGLSQVIVLSDCDCRGVTWDNSGTAGFPISLKVGETASGQITDVPIMSSSDTPSCSLSDCSSSIEILQADGSPLPVFMTYFEPTLTVAPTQTSEGGIYSLLVK